MLTAVRVFLTIAALVLALAFAGLVAFQPIAAQAQMMMVIYQIECGPAEITQPDPQLFEEGGEVFDLDEEESAAYVAATSRGTRYSRDMVLRVVVRPGGPITAIFIHDGLVCDIAEVEPALHSAAMRSIRGIPL